MTANALIGYTGFIGSTLLKQRSFESLYRSTNISDITTKKFGSVICAGAPAQKWIANREPESDLKNIMDLIDHLKRVQTQKFILVSTVDVFNHPIGVTEDSPIDKNTLHPYGLHRYILEEFVQNHFSDHLIVRLPGLIGPGLRKNIIFDLLNDNNLHSIDSRGTFQFYPMVNLMYDVQIALNNQLKLIHLTAEPISVNEIAENGFGKSFDQVLDTKPLFYDFQTKYASLFGENKLYQYTKKETIQAVRFYAQSENKHIQKESS